MTWLTPTEDLRKLMSDGATDKLNWRKRVLPAPDGVITTFKTFENRRVTDFSSVTGSAEGVYVNGVVTFCSADDTEVGEFTLLWAPDAGTYVEATYYFQWFTDDELSEFLATASQWLGGSEVYANTAGGLQPAALAYAAAQGYQKLALRWALSYSTNYKMEDQPQPERAGQIQNPYAEMSKDFLAKAEKLRDDFYKRQSQGLAPRFLNIPGRVRKVEPNR